MRCIFPQIIAIICSTSIDAWSPLLKKHNYGMVV